MGIAPLIALGIEFIIDIIVKQPATAQFTCRRLYQFFVADEVIVV